MATTARNKQDVDNMTRDERLWDSLNYSYGKKRESSDKAYQKAYSQADRQALSRGMQRSSYNAQNLANINQQQIEAQNDIWDAQIADYENRLQQQEEAETARAFQTSEREAQQAWQSQENAFNRAFQTSEREAQQLYNTSEREAQQAWQSGENALARSFQTSEREAQQGWQAEQNQKQLDWQAEQNRIQNEWQAGQNQAQWNWQSGENEKNRAFTTAEREAQQLYNTAEREAQQNWQAQENAYNRAFTTAEREAQQAYNTAERLAQQGYNTSEREAQQRYQSAESELARAFQAEQNAASLAQNQSQFEAQMAFNREQAAVQQDQWAKEFGYNEKTTEQKIAMEYVMNAAQQGGDVSDDLLSRAGLSREDYNAMKKDAVSSGTSNSGGKTEWEKLGIPKTEYDAWKSSPYANLTYEEYLKAKNQTSDDDFMRVLGETPVGNSGATLGSVVDNIGKAFGTLGQGVGNYINSFAPNVDLNKAAGVVATIGTGLLANKAKDENK